MKEKRNINIAFVPSSEHHPRQRFESLLTTGKSCVITERAGLRGCNCLCHKQPVALGTLCSVCGPLIFQRGAKVDLQHSFQFVYSPIQSKQRFRYKQCSDLPTNLRLPLVCLKYYQPKLQSGDSSKIETRVAILNDNRWIWDFSLEQRKEKELGTWSGKLQSCREIERLDIFLSKAREL